MYGSEIGPLLAGACHPLPLVRMRQEILIGQYCHFERTHPWNRIHHHQKPPHCLSMLIVNWNQYSPLDRFLNRFKRKGFYLYSGLILVSTLYVMYSISNPIDKDREQKRLREERKKEREEKREQRKLKDRKAKTKRTETDIELDTLARDHIIHTWTKKQLFSYLFEQRIFPDIDDDLDIVRSQVIDIYDKREAIANMNYRDKDKAVK